VHCSTGVTCSNDKVLLEVGFSSECRAKCSGNVHFSALLVQFGFYFSWCEGLKSEGNSYSSAACEKVLLVVHFSSQCRGNCSQFSFCNCEVGTREEDVWGHTIRELRVSKMRCHDFWWHRPW
jgi:hypothetical protein